ncbi:metalloregulator ArsR/SmtB family transcription factor [uncultured Cellulomonas sp.]|uniref:ArsR/SmtB family transcription factor n=1 Tax=uncultured Cellulomonas sp. TaxID=189682 RepID=UPI00260EC693|nr:metalloregulator ArsR/SmtB family transcription factor [uncultured Cellulomonas sp.]
MHEDTQPAAPGVDPAYVEIAVEVFAMLADATRVRIVLALLAGELTVGELAQVVDRSPTSVSQHLAKLRLARMVAARQDGNRVHYRLINDHVGRLVTDGLQQAEHAVDPTPHHHEQTS